MESISEGEIARQYPDKMLDLARAVVTRKLLTVKKTESREEEARMVELIDG